MSQSTRCPRCKSESIEVIEVGRTWYLCISCGFAFGSKKAQPPGAVIT